MPYLAWQFFNASSSVAKMVKKGLRAHIGAHGEPPLGLNYHSEMSFTQRGGLSNYEVCIVIRLLVQIAQCFLFRP
jgi:hypothetical protein